jgi:hypothetical protein
VGDTCLILACSNCSGTIVADGSQTTANLQVTAELQMRKYCHNVTFQATAMLPQFYSRFGSDWSNQHEVLADFDDIEHSVQPR